jgi:hypothetical protein
MPSFPKKSKKSRDHLCYQFRNQVKQLAWIRVHQITEAPSLSLTAIPAPPRKKWPSIGNNLSGPSISKTELVAAVQLTDSLKMKISNLPDLNSYNNLEYSFVHVASRRRERCHG